MGATAAALPRLAALEATTHPPQSFAGFGPDCRARVEVRVQRPRALVELGRLAPECGATNVLLHSLGAALTPRYTPAPPVCHLNRRMRNRTYGGVGGRRG
jgi:hypothetical protein